MKIACDQTILIGSGDAPNKKDEHGSTCREHLPVDVACVRQVVKTVDNSDLIEFTIRTHLRQYLHIKSQRTCPDQ
jgi:hypothetical protein